MLSPQATDSVFLYCQIKFPKQRFRRCGDQADIPKIVVMPNERKDVLTLLDATREIYENCGFHLYQLYGYPSDGDHGFV